MTKDYRMRRQRGGRDKEGRHRVEKSVHQSIEGRAESEVRMMLRWSGAPGVSRVSMSSSNAPSLSSLQMNRRRKWKRRTRE